MDTFNVRQSLFLSCYPTAILSDCLSAWTTRLRAAPQEDEAPLHGRIFCLQNVVLLCDYSVRNRCHCRTYPWRQGSQRSYREGRGDRQRQVRGEGVGDVSFMMLDRHTYHVIGHMEII